MALSVRYSLTPSEPHLPSASAVLDDGASSQDTWYVLGEREVHLQLSLLCFRFRLLLFNAFDAENLRVSLLESRRPYSAIIYPRSGQKHS